MARTRPQSRRKIGVLDFETDPFKYGRMPRPFAAGYYDGEQYREWWGPQCVDDIAAFLLDQNAVVYAHNGGKFDFFYLLRYLNIDDDQKFKLLGGRIAQAIMGKCELRDSFLILPQALSAYQKDDISYDIFEADQREKPKNKKEIRKYLKSDCVYLWEWVSSFVERFGRKLTVASAAFSELRKTGYPVNRETSESYDDTFRPYYYGGRCNALKPGVHKGKYYYVDLNSAYPHAMLSQHPLGSKYETWTRDDLANELPDNDCYVAKITAVSRGALPTRDEKTKKINYPNDGEIREYNASGWEIRAGVETGTLDVKTVELAMVHENTRDFSEYVNKFYNEKAAAKACGDKSKETHAKFMLNSCYGKFGQDGRAYKKYSLFPTGYNPLTTEDRAMAVMLGMSPGDYLTRYLEYIEETETPAGFSIWSQPDPVDQFYNVATAASITAYVRAHLWRAICACKNPIYCDTDSIICQGYDIDIGTALGEWSLDAQTKHNGVVYIGGRKLYTFKDKQNEVHKAHKGARLTHDDIVKIVRDGRTFEWYNEAPSFSLRYGIYPDTDLTKRDPRSKRTGFIKRRIKATAA